MLSGAKGLGLGRPLCEQASRDRAISCSGTRAAGQSQVQIGWAKLIKELYQNCLTWPPRLGQSW